MDTKIILPKYKPWYFKFINKKGIEQKYFNDAFLVKCSSPKKDKNVVYKLACYFRREFKYDFVQFCPLEIDDYEAYIFADYIYRDEYEAYGACCFRRREDKEGKYWALQWIWFHPYFREKGILSKHWPFFRERYGDFEVEGPYSKAMYHAINKLNSKEDDKEQKCNPTES